MPRAPKTKTTATVKSEPYDNTPDTKPELDSDADLKPTVKAKATRKTNKDDAGTPRTAPPPWDRKKVVELVVKGTAANFDALSAVVGKTPAQCKDTWRKTVYPAMLKGGEWSTGGPGWDRDMKLKLMKEVLGTAKPDWDVIVGEFPGRSKNQLKDIWRKVVYPKLEKGEAMLS